MPPYWQMRVEPRLARPAIGAGGYADTARWNARAGAYGVPYAQRAERPLRAPN